MRVVLVVMASLVACGGPAGGGAHGTTVAARRVEYTPAATRTRRYDGRTETYEPRGAEAVVYASLVGLTRPSLTIDAALHRAAAQLLTGVGSSGEAPPGPVVEFVTRWEGLIEPQPALFVAQAPDPAGLGHLLAESMGDSVSRVPFNRIGVAVRDLSGGGTQALVLVSMRYCTIDPMDVALPAGRSIVLRGRLAPPFHTPRVIVTGADDRTHELAPVATGDAFSVALPDSGRGEAHVEVVAEGTRGVTVLANFPIWIGQEPPRTVSYDASPGAGMTADEVAVELVRLANEARRARGLPPLALLPVLERVALAHSQDMRDHDFIAHTSPTTGSPSDRLARAGFHSALVLENIGRAYSAREIHEGLMLSPGHRANLLHRDATHIGVGVVTQSDTPSGEREQPGDAQAIIATEVFARVTAALDPRTASSDLVRLVNERRQQLGAPPLEGDAGLSRLAQQAVQHFLRDRVGQREVVDTLNESLESFGLAYRRVSILFSATTSLEDTAAMEPLMDPGVRVLGIGIAQGEHPEIGHPAIVTIVVMAWPR